MKINYFLGQWLNSKEGDVIFDGKKKREEWEEPGANNILKRWKSPLHFSLAFLAAVIIRNGVEHISHKR